MDQPLYNVEWKLKAEKALRTVKQKKRMITARLSVLRQHEKQHNIKQHKARNELLIHELKEIVTPSAFLNCVRRAEEMLSSYSHSLPEEVGYDGPKSIHRMNTALVNDVTAGKPLTITLPDISSKAFWSGSGKTEVFHPETYKCWVKEAIEQYCAIARIDVEVK